MPLGSYKKGWNEPLLVNTQDRNDLNFVLSFGEDTEVHKSCSVTFRNRNYVFGGVNHRRQISEVKNCELKRIGSLDFDHFFGTCSSVGDREIWLCFDATDKRPWEDYFKECRVAVDPLGNFTKVANSAFPHRYARTAASAS